MTAVVFAGEWAEECFWARIFVLEMGQKMPENADKGAFLLKSEGVMCKKGTKNRWNNRKNLYLCK